MNEHVQRRLQECIEGFAAQVTEILKDAVADGVASALGGSRRAQAPVQRGRGRPKARSKAVDKAGRRTRERVQQEADALLKEVQRKGGRRAEQIAKSMRTSTKALVTPMKKLLAAKRVKKSGVARGTTYRAA